MPQQHRPWIEELWLAQHAIARQREGGVFPYLIPDRHCGWIPWAGRTGTLNGYGYFANALGLRADPTQPEAPLLPTDKPLALVVGDSHVHGDEVGFAATWIERLNRHGRLPFHLVNAGVPGYGADQACWRFDALRDRVMPTIGILGVATCDFTRHVNMLRFLRSAGTGVPFVKPVFDLVDGRFQKIDIPAATIENFAETFTTPQMQQLLAAHDFFSPESPTSRPIRQLVRRVAIRHLPRLVAASSDARRLRRALGWTFTERPMAATLHILRTFKDSCIDTGIMPVVLFLPIQSDYRRGSISDLIYRWLRREIDTCGMPCLDPHATLAPRFAASDVWAEGGHVNVRGAAMLADALAGDLRRLADKSARIQQYLRDLPLPGASRWRHHQQPAAGQ